MLRVIGQRPDGYHELQTVFQFVTCCDYLIFRRRNDNSIRMQEGLPGVDHQDNLIIRAAQLLQQHCDQTQGVDISIEKHIPMGGGLGGGSSDAATTLLALNQLWDTRLSKEMLAQLGRKLGADVPIFVHGHAAWAEGTGEQFSEIALPEPWYLIIKPDCEISTADIFSDCRLTRDADRITIRDFLSGDDGNDCRAVVEIRYPQVKKALQWLSQYGAAKLTGTGACVFAAFDSQPSANAARDTLPEPWAGWVCKGLNRSPVLEKL